jgi:hypothetical protein
MSDITDFIAAAVNDKPLAAQQAFDSAMQSRVSDVVAAKYQDMQATLFNGSDSAIDETEYLELESSPQDSQETEDNDE